ncbi:MAG: tripartite tricarboxylate transporter substrate binding protein [Betaproteobacteria bacterium]|nr:tripartite tricarboxylate transporter substrate binding protein [Betaproteobacteria bacterium]
MIAKQLTVAALAWVLLVAATDSPAQNFPTKPIRFIVPFAGGGSPDVLARVVGKKVSESLGQPVLVENKPGASGIIAAETVAKAPADGHTVFVSSVPHLAINPHMFRKLPYDPLKDFAPIAIGVSTQLFLVVNASLPANSIQEFLAYAKSHPGLTYGTPGTGSQHHLAMELFKQRAGISLVHVPYKGVAQSTMALLAGEINIILTSYPTVGQHVKAGKLRLLAIAEGKRYARMPELPTIAEAGLPGYRISTEIGFVAPAGTPKPVIEKLNSEIVKALKNPEIAQQLITVGMEPIGSTPEQYAESIRANHELYGKMVKISGAQATD